ncbi:MAG: restriction endonuclease [Deltaproteobacteria bacterium]|nr:restriction endonuclease [Deltaproteobacteria bacterium]
MYQKRKGSRRKGPEFIRFLKPIVEILKSLDGSGTAGEVVDMVIEKMNISDEELAVQNKNGGSRIKNQVHWARQYLVDFGVIDNSARGIWSLTPYGEKLEIINHKHALEIFDSIQSSKRKNKSKSSDIADVDRIELSESDMETSEDSDSPGDYQSALISLLRKMPPSGFEKICQRLLRESGFKNVKVLGKTGDGGIDGEGILEVNPLLSFKVLFQSKKYGANNSVQAHHVRDFRGAMQGRADKGLIITTGSFTKGAKAEAVREGVPPIELIDSEALVELFEKIELGLKPVKTWEIDQNFFAPFYDE